ncbi:hypothetical protein SAMN05444359_12760 [Neolewinella agarilytica]|uniref:Uncharacterized protein n=1 Tax=Neolewinella agarilytica TaxID=478744 RepID=A0A1H9M7N7_9BACT|nr:hypothetical protein SAMN05444359_12760 [Neolewinella agarilytica]
MYLQKGILSIFLNSLIRAIGLLPGAKQPLYIYIIFIHFK